MLELNFIFLPLFGFIIGLLVSTLGGGGGGFFVPVLILVFGVPSQVAIATSLASVLPTTITGAVSHFRQGNLDIRTGLILGVGGIVGTLIGAYIASNIPSNLLTKILGVFTLIMVVPMALSALKRSKNSGNGKTDDSKNRSLTLTGPKKIIASLFGVASGMMAGVFGISGTPPVIAGLYSLGLPAVMVVGTSVFVLIFNSFAGIGGYYLLGRLNFTLIILLGGGSAVGAFMGPLLLKKINPKTLEKAYAPILVGIMLTFGVALIIA